jgi:hypothetical protein
MTENANHWNNVSEFFALRKPFTPPLSIQSERLDLILSTLEKYLHIDSFPFFPGRAPFNRDCQPIELVLSQLKHAIEPYNKNNDNALMVSVPSYRSSREHHLVLAALRRAGLELLEKGFYHAFTMNIWAESLDPLDPQNTLADDADEQLILVVISTYEALSIGLFNVYATVDTPIRTVHIPHINISSIPQNASALHQIQNAFMKITKPLSDAEMTPGYGKDSPRSVTRLLLTGEAANDEHLRDMLVGILPDSIMREAYKSLSKHGPKWATYSAATGVAKLAQHFADYLWFYDPAAHEEL